MVRLWWQEAVDRGSSDWAAALVSVLDLANLSGKCEIFFSVYKLNVDMIQIMFRPEESGSSCSDSTACSVVSPVS